MSSCKELTKRVSLKRNEKWGDRRVLRRTDFPPLQVVKTIRFSAPELFKNESFLRQKYEVERLSTTDLARLTFSSKSSVLKYLKKFGIPIREVGRTLTKRPGYGLKFGWRIINRREVRFRREQETILKMRELRKLGFSYGKVADTLNALSVPTKTGKAKWTAKTVHQVLNAHVSSISP